MKLTFEHPKVVKFKTKYTNELNSKDLPKQSRHVRLELKDSDYAKLFMQNNPIHDHDREKASSIAQNITYNKQAIKTNPHFQKMKITENQFDLSKKEMYR